MSQDICARCGINEAVAGDAGGGVCYRCLRAAEPNPDPSITLPKSRLAAILRECWDVATEKAIAEMRSDPGTRYYADKDTYIARALRQAEGGQA